MSIHCCISSLVLHQCISNGAAQCISSGVTQGISSGAAQCISNGVYTIVQDTEREQIFTPASIVEMP